jgi:hypothetical protein
MLNIEWNTTMQLNNVMTYAYVFDIKELILSFGLNILIKKEIGYLMNIQSQNH